MGMAKKLLQGLTRRAVTKTMDRVGGRLVSRIADTSADAPSAFTEPKRDVYRHMAAGELRVPATPDPQEADSDDPDGDRGHEG